MMGEINWDERYSGQEYKYGVEPNAFLFEHSAILAGPVLSIGEGEGRNAVFLATLGLEVHAVDGSAVGLGKARKLAESRGMKIQTQVVDLHVFVPTTKYQSVISIFAHLPQSIRNRLYPLLVDSMNPGAHLLLEAYSVKQIQRDTGGPKDLDMLMSVEKIEREFPSLEPILLREIDRDVSEGKYHTGIASVVQFIGRK